MLISNDFIIGFAIGAAVCGSVILITLLVIYTKKVINDNQKDRFKIYDQNRKWPAPPPPPIKRTKLKIPVLDWVMTDKNDFSAKFDTYLLRVEKMNSQYWWWAVYKGDEQIAFDDPIAKTKDGAKIIAEYYFLHHWISGKDVFEFYLEPPTLPSPPNPQNF